MNPRAVDSYDVAPYDAAIVLGARIQDDGTPSPALSRRVGHAVDLLRSGAVRALLMTGGATTSPIPEAHVMRDLALAAGARADAVHMETRALNTIENALFTAPIAQGHGWRRLLVVTDTFHVPRAWYVFRRFGLPAAMAGVKPEAPSVDWWLAHGREAAALPWTVLRVEARLLLPGG
jgi:uncharacterized SAM-binding protein YcdF (DUF218 family)